MKCDVGITYIGWYCARDVKTKLVEVLKCGTCFFFVFGCGKEANIKIT